MAASETVSMIIKLLADGSQFTKTLTDAQQQAKKSAKEIASSIQDIAGKAGTAMTLFGGAVTGGLGMAAKAANDFDAAFAKITTQLDGEYAEPAFIQGLKDGIFDIAKEAGIAVPDAIEAVYTALQAGIPEKNVMQFVRDGAKAAVAGVTDLSSVMDVTTSVMDSYAMSADRASYIQDVLFKGVDIGKIEFRDFAQYLGQVLPIASAAGVSFEDLVGSIASLTRSGFKPSEAITSLRSALSNVLKPSEDAKKAAKALGFDFSVAALKTKGLDGFMNELFQTMGKKVDWQIVDTNKAEAEKKKLQGIQKQIEDTQAALLEPKNANKKPALTKKLEELKAKASESEQQIAALYTTAAEKLDRETGAAKLFGDVQGLAAVLAMGNNEAKVFNESLEATNNAAGATADAFGKMAANNPELAFKQMTATLTEFMVNVGRPLLQNVFAPMARAITAIVGTVGEWVKANPVLAATLTGIVAAVGAVSLVMGGLLLIVGKLAGAYLAWTGMQTALAGGLSAVGIGGTAAGAGATAAGTGAAAGSTGFFALAAGVWAALAPILITVGIVMAVIAALALLYFGLKMAAESKYGKAFFDWLYSVWEGIASAWDKAVDWLAGFFTRLVSAIESGVDLAAEGFAALGRALMDSVGSACDWVLNKLADLWGKIKNVGSAALDALNPFSDNDSGGSGGNIPGFATGGVVTRKTLAFVGEAGPEAIIPLRGGGVPVAFTSSGPVGTGSTKEGVQSSVYAPISVYPQPGQSPTQIADEVGRVIARRKGMA